MNHIGRYTERPSPELSLAARDVYDLGLRKHYMTAVLELDVTDARRGIRLYRRNTGEGLSFTAWFVKCVAQAVGEFPEVHAMRKGRRKVVLFEDVDIGVPVQKKMGDNLAPMPLLIRKANEKSLKQIHDEIEQAKRIEVGDDIVLDDRKHQRLLRWAMRLPKAVRMIWWKSMTGNPFRTKQTMGTVAVTSVAMFGKVHAWGIPISIHPLCFALGSITTKPGVVHGQVVPREFLNLTVLIDHDVVDGGPAARFLARLNELIGEGYSLPKPSSSAPLVRK